MLARPIERHKLAGVALRPRLCASLRGPLPRAPASRARPGVRPGLVRRDDAARLAGLIEHLPEGLSEIYLHPATGPYPGSAPGYRYAEELAALTDPAHGRA